MNSQIAAAWVSAIGSAGSLLGFTAYVLLMLLNRKDQAEVRQEQQAQGVAAWLSERTEPGPEDGRVVLCVYNGGQTPVFNLRCLFSVPSSNDQHSISLSLIPPSTTAYRSMPFDSIRMSDDELYSAQAVPEMRFTDSHGTNWQRDANGRLKRLDRRTLRLRPSRDGTGASTDNRDDTAWEREHAKATGDTTTHRHDQQ